MSDLPPEARSAIQNLMKDFPRLEREQNGCCYPLPDGKLCGAEAQRIFVISGVVTPLCPEHIGVIAAAKYLEVFDG